jgi:hypothetical protein
MKRSAADSLYYPYGRVFHKANFLKHLPVVPHLRVTARGATIEFAGDGYSYCRP